MDCDKCKMKDPRSAYSVTGAGHDRDGRQLWQLTDTTEMVTLSLPNVDPCAYDDLQLHLEATAYKAAH